MSVTEAHATRPPFNAAAAAGGRSPTMDADARTVPSRGPFGAAPTAEPARTERWNNPANAPRVRPGGLGSRPAVAPHPRCTRYAQAKVVAAQPRCPAQGASSITAARPVSTAPRSAALSTSLSSFRRRSTSITSTTITAQWPSRGERSSQHPSVDLYRDRQPITISRGRDGPSPCSFGSPPAQIPASGTTALGSCLG